MSAHDDYLDLADQWLVQYACVISRMPIPTLFTIGHRLEAYCKAALLKSSPDRPVFTKGEGHHIEGFISRIQAETGLLRQLSFFPEVENRFMTGGLIPLTESLSSEPIYRHYLENQELYWIAKFQQELKYLGTPGKRMPSQFSVLVMARNPYWIPILGELRKYVAKEFPQEGLTAQRFLRCDAPDFAKEYVANVCNS